MTPLRSPSPLLVTLTLALVGACGVPPDSSMSDADAGTTGAADSSTGAGGSGSATSTTGQPPATSGTSHEPTATASGSDGATEDTGVVFLAGPDGGACSISGDGGGFQVRCSWCDVVAQDCPEGEKCVPRAGSDDDFWTLTRCSPIPEDPAPLGEACMVEGNPFTGIDDCVQGALCFEVDPRTLEGTCAELCDPYSASCGEDEVCADYTHFAPFVCLPRCDPTNPTACAKDETCREVDDDVLCVPNIVAPQGFECGGDDQHCTPDQACLPADELAGCAGVQCCTPWCDLSAADPDLPCSAVPGEVCRPFFDTPPAGYEHVGACELPL